jgi:hypothetical protein
MGNLYTCRVQCVTGNLHLKVALTHGFCCVTVHVSSVLGTVRHVFLCVTVCQLISWEHSSRVATASIKFRSACQVSTSSIIMPFEFLQNTSVCRRFSSCPLCQGELARWVLTAWLLISSAEHSVSPLHPALRHSERTDCAHRSRSVRQLLVRCSIDCAQLQVSVGELTVFNSSSSLFKFLLYLCSNYKRSYSVNCSFYFWLCSLLILYSIPQNFRDIF